jgi:hypothetical protein
MKKILTTAVLAAFCSTAANAQSAANSSGTKAPASVQSGAMRDKMDSANEQRNEKREERMKNMSPEQRERMMERREKFNSLSPEKKEEAKAEMKRHREEMHKITGEEPKGHESQAPKKRMF